MVVRVGVFESRVTNCEEFGAVSNDLSLWNGVMTCSLVIYKRRIRCLIGMKVGCSCRCFLEDAKSLCRNWRSDIAICSNPVLSSCYLQNQYSAYRYR